MLLTDLPMDILAMLMKECPQELRPTCRLFFILHNDLYFDKMLDEMGPFVLVTLVNSKRHIINYMKSLDYWRGHLRSIISNAYELPVLNWENDLNDAEPSVINEKMNHSNVLALLNYQHLRDSWQFVYSLFKNRRLFVEYSDYQVDEPMNYMYRHVLQINKTYLLYYKKTIRLSPDIYNITCALIVNNALGLGTIKFQVLDHNTGKELLVYYPPNNISEMIPQRKLTLLDLGNFAIAPKSKESLMSHGLSYDLNDNKLVEVDIILEETGLYLKSGFTLCYIDVVAYPNKHPIKTQYSPNSTLPLPSDKWLFCYQDDHSSIEPDKVIHILLKNCYKSINKWLSLPALPPLPPKVRRMSVAESLVSFEESEESPSLAPSLMSNSSMVASTNSFLNMNVNPILVSEENEDRIRELGEKLIASAKRSKVKYDCLDSIDFHNYSKLFFSRYVCSVIPRKEKGQLHNAFSRSSLKVSGNEEGDISDYDDDATEDDEQLTASLNQSVDAADNYAKLLQRARMLSKPKGEYIQRKYKFNTIKDQREFDTQREKDIIRIESHWQRKRSELATLLDLIPSVSSNDQDTNLFQLDEHLRLIAELVQDINYWDNSPLKWKFPPLYELS
ncbi:Hypothetical protein KP2612_000862 [Komagataella phaffii]|uniref:Uncharacterized protein n=2 Tax=Komagataella phaffii TaxID=460519 RepID=C4QXA2_KOMPG|nr:Hypothetical protein PAS_chr1-4_0044 [Komagataella phaffii GS115]AOA60627.1 GQ67_02144T0 [Komagataella phaffii]AOA66340.1 GQ68_02159T0 [Komagataella phaffii GS115]CAY67875.1 Hypothetical protein PAS_chr1-4_0044 [Komagataella phaffii GS115]